MPRTKKIKYSVYTRTVGVEMAVFNREGTFYVEYTTPLTSDHKKSRSLKIKVDEKLSKNSSSYPIYTKTGANWWMKSKQKDKIIQKIGWCLLKRDDEVLAYLKKHSQLSKGVKDPTYQKVVAYLLKKDKPLIAHFFLTRLSESGLEKIYDTFTKKDLNELNGAYFFRSLALMDKAAAGGPWHSFSSNGK